MGTVMDFLCCLSIETIVLYNKNVFDENMLISYLWFVSPKDPQTNVKIEIYLSYLRKQNRYNRKSSMFIDDFLC